ncbi:hypothetical protein ACH5A2_17230 [Streptomyces collinus]|uniref:hypothetical protein n=1 Tax=Streptomyces collinus TaxID=42684 RepID=UPI0037A63FD1
MKSVELPEDLAAEVQAATTLLAHAETGTYEEIKARRTILQVALARHEKAIPTARRSPDEIMAEARRLHRAAQEGFRALREAELRLPPSEAVEAARAHLMDLADDVAMGAWLSSVDAARDDLIAAVDRLIAAQKAFYIADGGD